MLNLPSYIWFILSLCISVLNDSLRKFLVNYLSVFDISFLGFGIAFFSMLFFRFYELIKKKYLQLYYNKSKSDDIKIKFRNNLKKIDIFSQKTVEFLNNIKLHFRFIHIHCLRGFIFALAIALWNIGIHVFPILFMTMMSFTIPFFTVLLSRIFLKENVTYETLLYLFLSFIGALIVVSNSANFYPSYFNIEIDVNTEKHTYIYVLLILLACNLFSGLDIINKKLLLSGENNYNMIMYSSLFTCFFNFLLSHDFSKTFATLNDNNLYWLVLLLGIGNNLILFCILRAFKNSSLSSLSPLRYIEILISGIVGYLFFYEVPNNNMYIGGALIVFSSVFSKFRETKVFIKKKI